MSYNAASPVVDGQTVILTSPGAGTKALTIEKSDAGFAAKELWTNKDTSAQFSTPVLKDGRLYGISNAGNFFCIEAATGKTLWISPERYGERGFGTVVYAGNVLLSLTSGSDLVVFTPGDKAYAEVARLKLSNVPSYSYPVAAGNRVFIKDRDSVMMYALE
jgi:outer membrane protein assembly factor BamB